MKKKHPRFGKSMGTNFPGSSHKMGFVTFSGAMGYWWEDLDISPVNYRVGIWWQRTTHNLGKKMDTNFPGSSHKMGFNASFNTMGYWWEDLCIFHVIKQTISWKPDGKEPIILWVWYPVGIYLLVSLLLTLNRFHTLL